LSLPPHAKKNHHSLTKPKRKKMPLYQLQYTYNHQGFSVYDIMYLVKSTCGELFSVVCKASWIGGTLIMLDLDQWISKFQSNSDILVKLNSGIDEFREGLTIPINGFEMCMITHISTIETCQIKTKLQNCKKQIHNMDSRIKSLKEKLKTKEKPIVMTCTVETQTMDEKPVQRKPFPDSKTNKKKKRKKKKRRKNKIKEAENEAENEAKNEAKIEAKIEDNSLNQMILRQTEIDLLTCRMKSMRLVYRLKRCFKMWSEFQSDDYSFTSEEASPSFIESQTMAPYYYGYMLDGNYSYNQITHLPFRIFIDNEGHGAIAKKMNIMYKQFSRFFHFLLCSVQRKIFISETERMCSYCEKVFNANEVSCCNTLIHTICGKCFEKNGFLNGCLYCAKAGYTNINYMHFEYMCNLIPSITMDMIYAVFTEQKDLNSLTLSLYLSYFTCKKTGRRPSLKDAYEVIKTRDMEQIKVFLSDYVFEDAENIKTYIDFWKKVLVCILPQKSNHNPSSRRKRIQFLKKKNPMYQRLHGFFLLRFKSMDAKIIA
jgi:hypothetical protein